jgi:hypothetical protein
MTTRDELLYWYDTCSSHIIIYYMLTGFQEQAEPYPNIELLHAYIPDPFGTHHSKMLVLFRHDDRAQVVIHTANMISRVSTLS